MPPRPFPYALRVGTDLCNVARLRSIIARPHNGTGRPPLQQFLGKILTHPERHYFHKRFGNMHDASASMLWHSFLLEGAY
jgi:holo-[acyl-carrier protein] synthase